MTFRVEEFPNENAISVLLGFEPGAWFAVVCWRQRHLGAARKYRWRSIVVQPRRPVHLTALTLTALTLAALTLAALEPALAGIRLRIRLTALRQRATLARRVRRIGVAWRQPAVHLPALDALDHAAFLAFDHTAFHALDHAAFDAADHTAFHAVNHTAFHAVNHSAFHAVNHSAVDAVGHQARNGYGAPRTAQSREHLRRQQSAGTGRSRCNRRKSARFQRKRARIGRAAAWKRSAHDATQPSRWER
jgi:hypothetical protein